VRPLRPSSIVLLTRGGGDAVYLVERAPELAFFGGFHALPGGVLDPRDGALEEDEERAFAVCAARELFEETGVLVPGLAEGLGHAERGALRAALIADAPEAPAGDGFWERARGAALDALTPLGFLVTPPFAPVRYRTRLYHLELPAGEEPSILPGELVAGGFVAPGEELACWRRGERRIVPPVLFLLEALAERTFDAALAHASAACAAAERGELHAVRIAPGVRMAPLATPTIPPATTTNAFLVGAERLFVVDPATPHPAEQERFFALLDRLVAAGQTLAGVLVTHHHPDHVGAVAATSRRYGLEVRAHARTLERLAGDMHRGAPLADGDALELGRAPDGSPGWRLECVHTPGHDQGHLIFVESRHRTAIAGDLVSTLSTIVIDPPEGHMATYLASLRRARDLELGVLCPAHGPASTRPRELLERMLRHRAQREAKLAAALSEGSASAERLLERVYDDVPAELLPVAARSLAAGLEKLAEEGRAAEVGGRWVPVR
jgi:glyoxylase-like metal-dependent hydrolase (beta-lactamase superfamily II)/8-oxo-dGTP pyrophosphatase MutT (NUDIX family)